MIKFSLKQKQLDFMEGWATSEYDMRGMGDDEPDLLATFSTVKGGLDNILAMVGQDDKE